MWCTACRWKKACQRFTDWSSPAARQTNKPCSFPAEENKGKRGGASSCMHSVFFRSTSQLSVSYGPALVLRLRPTPHPTSSAPLNHSSCGSNRRTAESPFTSPSGIPSVGSPFPSFPVFGKTSVQLNSVKKKRFLQFFCFLFLMLGSVLHLSMFCTALVFKWKSCQRRGLRTRPNDFFFFFKCVFSQKIRVKNTFLFKRRRELSEVRFKKAMKKHVEVKLAVFVLPSTCSSLCIQFWTLRWSFITVPHASRTAPRECMRGIAGKGWWTVGKEEEETHTYTNTHEMNDQCKKRKRKKKKNK